MKKIYLSKTIQFFTLVLVGGGLDILDTLIRSEVLDARSIILAGIGIAGIALRLITSEPVKL